MTALDLSPIDRRLDWAQQHADRVKDLSGGWAATAMRTTTTDDVNGGVTVYRAEIVGEPPATIALALGDVLHNARAALDNLVALLRGGATSQSAYRIDTDPERFDRDEHARLDGVPDWARAAMRQVQPFPDNPWRHVGQALLQLHDLAILDRHRALLLSGAVIDIHRTYAATDHGVHVEFGLLNGGRAMTTTYPIGATVHPTSAVEVVVCEDRLQWPDTLYPPFPSAEEVAKSALWATRIAVDMVRNWRR